jgi:hypothetical protein
MQVLACNKYVIIILLDKTETVYCALLQEFGNANTTMGSTHEDYWGLNLGGEKLRNSFLDETKATFIFRELLIQDQILVSLTTV